MTTLRGSDLSDFLEALAQVEPVYNFTADTAIVTRKILDNGDQLFCVRRNTPRSVEDCLWYLQEKGGELAPLYPDEVADYTASCSNRSRT